MNSDNIIIVGAGACGLMAAAILSNAGKKVLILESRDRIGGRIMPLSKKDFGFPAEGGAEFIHGEAQITKFLLNEAGLSYISAPHNGQMWSFRNGRLEENTGGPDRNPEFEEYKKLVHNKLKELKKDLPVSDFLKKNFSAKKYSLLRDWINAIVRGYDAADPKKISTFFVRDEWLGGGSWQQARLKEGYIALLNFLRSKCKKNGVQIRLNHKVKSVENKDKILKVICENERIYHAERIIVTVPLPLINKIKFIPALPVKQAAIKKIGYGGVIKIILRFKSQWWINALEEDLSKMMFMLSDSKVPTWWTQYPAKLPVLVGWIPGPAAEKYKKLSEGKILELAIASLSSIFNIQTKILKARLVNSQVINWVTDPFSLGAYSYPTPQTVKALKELSKPVDNTIYFAGEALYSKDDTSTVEGALGSGKETAEKILKSI